MADRGRDLKFSILSDAARFDLAGPADEMRDLGDASKEAARDLDKLDAASEAAARAMGTLEDSARRTDLGDIGDDAKDTARKVETAFDSIARASRTSASKVDDETGKMRRSLDDVSTEASSTGREMAASFDGSADSVFDAFQELGANAGESFGKVAGVVGLAVASGIGVIRAEAEALRQLAGDLVEEMIDAGGQLNEAAIAARIQTMATEDPAAFVKLKGVVEGLTLSWEDFARAKAGDAEAAERTIQAIAALSTELTDNAAAAGSADGAMYAQQQQLNDLAGQVGTTAEAYRIAKEAVDATGQATQTAAERTASSARAADGAWGELRNSMGVPITAKVNVSAPTAAQLNAVRAGIVRGIGPVSVTAKVTPQIASRNIFYTTNNSRTRP